MQLMVAVRASTKAWRARCTISRACWSSPFTGTKRMFERPTASQIAAASAAAFSLAELAAHALRCHELALHRLTVWPWAWNRRAVRAGAGLDADRARRQRPDHRTEFAPGHPGLAQLYLASLIHAVQGEHVLGRFNSNGDYRHGLGPFRVS
jgi:hypothetical protein